MSSVLLLSCPDQAGIVAATAQAIADNGGDIVHAEQYVKADDGDVSATFFKRITFDSGNAATEPFRTAFAPTADRFEMNVDLRNDAIPVPQRSRRRSDHTASTTC